MPRFTITFTGRVQGVGFRFTAQQIARRLSVAGWVRNEPDGSVRCVVEGERREIDEFLAALQHAMNENIEKTDIQQSEAGGDLRDFHVRQ